VLLRKLDLRMRSYNSVKLVGRGLPYIRERRFGVRGKSSLSGSSWSEVEMFLLSS